MYPETSTIVALVLLGLGFFLLERSSDIFVDGAAMVARRYRLSPFIIGMVIIGFGTSAPELCVSLMAGIGDRANLSLGNAYGSCIFNIAGILGVAALIAPMAVKRKTALFAGLLLSAITAISLLFLYLGGKQLSRLEALALLLVFAVVFPLYCVFSKDSAEVDSGEFSGRLSSAFAKLVLGLAVLVGSSHLLVWGAVNLARKMGVSELMIGLTIVAVGTSLPELAAAIQSARRNETGFILGNIIGSNIFNTLVVVGLASVFHGAREYSASVYLRDLPAMLAASLSIAVFGFRGRIGRLHGFVWVLALVAYMALTIYQEIL